jgi:hypothetical protein
LKTRVRWKPIGLSAKQWRETAHLKSPQGPGPYSQPPKGSRLRPPQSHALGADESQTEGNAETRRWVSDGGEKTFLGSLAPYQVPGYGAAAPIDPPTRPVSANESHLEELPTGRVLTFRPNRLTPAFALSFSRRPWKKRIRRFRTSGVSGNRRLASGPPPHYLRQTA